MTSVLIHEERDHDVDTIQYVGDCSSGIVKKRRLQASDSTVSLQRRARVVVREVFLPCGYPYTVSEDYLEYQIWDTVQAFCSTLIGILTTQAILKGVGVGDAEALPFAAAISWVLKDGSGMIGRIVFAWWLGTRLDADCKKWRLFADSLNDLAMLLELCIPWLPIRVTLVLCLTTTMKALVGVAGGCTRAAVIQHQAIQGNSADVSAKDGSHETCINLLASIVGVLLIATFEEGQFEWICFVVFASVHIFANYKAVTCLMFQHLNTARYVLILRMYFRQRKPPGIVEINQMEPVVIGCGMRARDLCGFRVKVGQSFDQLQNRSSVSELKKIVSVYENKEYLVVPCRKTETIYVFLKNTANSDQMLESYLVAVILGLTMSIIHKPKKKLSTAGSAIFKSVQLLANFYATRIEDGFLSIDDQKTLLVFAEEEYRNMKEGLLKIGWDLTNSALTDGQWRTEWKNKTA